MTNEDWSEVVVTNKQIVKTPVISTRADKIEKMMVSITTAMDQVYQGIFDTSKTERIAALALSAQMELATFLADAECRAKQAKQELKYISAEAYAKHKAMPTDKKLTDNALEQLVNRDLNVKEAETKMAELERDFKKWQYVHGTMRDGHVFFRNLGKI